MSSVSPPYIGVDEATRDKELKAIDAFDPKVRTLIWLSFFGSHLSEPSDVPTFYSWTGYFFPQVLQALEAAGMTARARIFREAWSHPKPFLPQLPADLSNDKEFRKIELGAAFGDKHAFEADMLADVRSTPAVAAWLEQAHAGLSDRDRLDDLTNRLVRMPGIFDWDVLRTWPLPYRTLLLVVIYDGEVINGGVEQFFSNASGDLAPAVADALRLVGLPRQAGVVERGMRLFPQPYPTDRALRLKALKRQGLNENIPSDLDGNLDALTPLAPFGEPVRAAMAAYARRENVLPR